MGNTSHFRCSYHGWVYKNSGELIGVPYFKEAYNSKLDRKAWGLVSIRTDTYSGFVFGTLDDDAPPLEDHLGGFQFYLDIYLKPGPGGTEVYGPPDHWVAETDWKTLTRLRRWNGSTSAWSGGARDGRHVQRVARRGVRQKGMFELEQATLST